ncbi:TonB-dependent receptor [candidate division KSB1 bacterium]|nr:TonB-dependent receptor [candidate division KSB1 bacterium]
MKFSSILIIGSLLLGTAWAGVDFSGQVIDKKTGKTLSGANVVLENRNIGTSTDTDGKFIFRNIPDDELLLSVSYIGYAVYKIRLTPESGRVYEIALEPASLPGQQITVTATRAVERQTPVAFSSLGKQEIRNSYYGQDIPLLLSELPNVYAYSDAGTGFGYSYLKIRGFDQSRIGVMINGIPINDPEDHQVYWVDMPDLAENIDDIQVQRGVSNSLYGISAFGGSVNVLTSGHSGEKGLTTHLATGSYGTKKMSFSMNSGLIDNSYAISGRFSRIVSDGYRENSGIDFWSYFLAFSRFGERSMLRVNIYGGPELTYASWDAVHQDSLALNRRANPTAAKYHNSIDHFNQPHYQLLHEIRLSSNLTATTTLFAIQGKGYYELYKENRRLRDFGYQPYWTLDPQLFGADSLDYYETIRSESGEQLLRDEAGRYRVLRTDLVNQKWVEKEQYGVLPQLHWRHARGEVVVGGQLDRFRSRHHGTVIWAQALAAGAGLDPNADYYRYSGNKWTAALYIHSRIQLLPSIDLVTDLQYQHKTYDFNHHPAGNFSGADLHAYTLRYRFFNPKLGLNYNITRRWNLFSSFSFSQREPSDKDHYDAWEGPDDLGAAPLFSVRRSVWENGTIIRTEFSDPLIKPEELADFEFGIGYLRPDLFLKLNGYWMDFRNEIIPYGQMNDDGQPIRGNADQTVHRGIECSAQFDLDPLVVSGNFSWSQNYFKKFVQQGWDDNWQTIGQDLSGNSIPLFPDRLGNLRVTYTRGALLLSAHWQYIGRQYLDNQEMHSRSLPPYSVANLNSEIDLSSLIHAKGLSIGFRVINALNKTYNSSGYYDDWAGANFFYPAATRHYFAHVRISI